MNHQLTPSSDDTFVKLKPLVHVDAARVDASFDEMVRGLQGAPFSGTVRLTLTGGPEAQHVTISVRNGKAQRMAERKTADFEVITSPGTWLAIAEGSLAPLDAFTSGQMRVRGDVKLGRRAMTYLAAGAGRTDFC
jgi:putative sterol carrier protein